VDAAPGYCGKCDGESEHQRGAEQSSAIAQPAAFVSGPPTI
jgi:hypothetical protein